MKVALMKAGPLALLLAPLLLTWMAGAQTRPLHAEVGIEAQPFAEIARFQTDQAKQDTDAAARKKTQEAAANRIKRLKSHLANGNTAMHDAQLLREQIQTASGDQKAALMTKMNADYQTAIAEYQEALKNTTVADEEEIRPIGLVRLIRNGLISEQKAAEMEVQDKNLPMILSNLGMAYSGAGDYQDAIPMLQEAMASKPDPSTYMQLGTDMAEIGKVPQATATCDKIQDIDPTATSIQAACYKNIAIVLINNGKLADAVVPLQKATQLNSGDAFAWKLLGDALSNTIISTQENGKIIYTIPPGTVEAYQKYLQLKPNGPYSGQVKAALDGFAQMAKGIPISAATGKTP